MKIRHNVLRGMTLSACAAATLFATASLVQAQDPSVIITSPDPDESKGSSSVNVFLVAKANVGELAFVNVKMDDRAMVQADRMAFSNNGWLGYSVLFEDLAEGAHTVKAFPVDTETNFGYDRVDFTVNTEIIIDTEAPTMPTNLRLVNKSDSSITVAWNASSDNVGVDEYKLRYPAQDGHDAADFYPAGNKTEHTVTGLAANTDYRFKIKAIDAAGNQSAYTTPYLDVTTDPSGGDLITSPNNGAVDPGNITIEVSAPAGTENVKFSINGYEVKTDSSAPFKYTYNNLEGGTYTLSAVAKHGGMTTSDSVTITVDPTLLSGQFNFIRMNNNKPIMDKQMFKDIGANRNIRDNSEYEWDNMNGPCVIRIPNWVEERAHTDAVYYMYFGHHHGQCIRMAWAQNIEGPWTLFNMEAGVAADEKGVLAFDNNGKIGRDDQVIDIGNKLSIYDHMASPEILIDDDAQQIIMYFHSKFLYDGNVGEDQVTFVATSADGRSFFENIAPAIQSESYFSVFRYNDELYGLNSSGTMFRHPDPDNNLLEPGPGISFNYSKDRYWKEAPSRAVQWKEGSEDGGTPYVRHIKNYVDGDILYAAYSNTRGAPERLFYVEVDLSDGNWQDWHQEPSFNNPTLYHLAKAEAGWEGGHFNPDASLPSAMDEGVNQLRDPQFFRDVDGQFYMFYVGQGEDAIGVARLQWVD